MEHSSAAQLVGSHPGRSRTRELQATPPEGPGCISGEDAALHRREWGQRPRMKWGGRPEKGGQTENQKKGDRDPGRETEPRGGVGGEALAASWSTPLPYFTQHPPPTPCPPAILETSLPSPSHPPLTLNKAGPLTECVPGGQAWFFACNFMNPTPRQGN